MTLMLMKYQFLKKNHVLQRTHLNTLSDIMIMLFQTIMFKASTNDWLCQKFDENATMSFRANNKQLLKNYNKIWEKVEKLMRIDFESKPVYGDDDKYIKTKIKICADNMITNFHNKKMPKEKAPCKCLSIIMLVSVIKANKKYYPQTLFEEWKYVEEKITMENFIDDDLEKSESDSGSNDETESDICNDEYDE